MGGSRRRKGNKARADAKELLKNTDPEKRKAFETALRKRRGITTTKKTKRTTAKITVNELLEKVEECMQSFDYESAQRFCQQALEKEPTNLSALEMLGNILAETGNIEDAKNCFTRAIELSPDVGFAKYMYLGQLSEGLEAIKHFEKGIESMIKERDKAQEQENQEVGAGAEAKSPVSNSEISQAYSSIAEIYLTDACFEDDAEQRCKECLDRALEEDPRNAEAHQLMASYWLSKENKEKASSSIELSLAIWMPNKKTDQLEDTEEPVPLSYPLRIETSKILLELQNLDTAESVLLGLLEEDDEVVQVWYMLGLTQVERKTDEHKPYGRFYLNKAKKLYNATLCDDEPVLEHTKELLKQLGPGEGDEDDWLDKMQEQEAANGDQGEEGDEDWSDEEEEAMEH